MSPGPRRLHRVLAAAWARWKAIVTVIGTFQARVLLSVFYFTVVPPFALVVKLFKDPLGLRAAASNTFWMDRPAPDPTPRTGERRP